MKRRRTQKQIEAARANGARSKGPVTEAGKQKSSLNNLKHGLDSKIVVLNGEDGEYYVRFTAEYMDHYDPQTPVERDLVNDIVSARWRINRAMAMQTASLDLEVDRQRKAVEAEFIKTDEPTRCALAFAKLTGEGPSFTALDRHEARLRRTIEKATAQLEALQKARKERETEICRDEPENAEPAPAQEDAAPESRLIPLRLITLDLPPAPLSQRPTPPVPDVPERKAG
jgi:hypothetical protein